MVSLAGDAPLPSEPGAPSGMPPSGLAPLGAWFRGAFRIAHPRAEVGSCQKGALGRVAWRVGRV